MRKVTIYSTKTKVQQTLETDVTLWGELKALIDPEMGVSSSRCMVRENRTTLESNQAILPDTDITIFVYPEKVKSGTDRREDDVYASFSDEDLILACQRKSLATNEKGHVMRSSLRAYDLRHGFTGPQAHLCVKVSARPTVVDNQSLQQEALDVGEVHGTYEADQNPSIETIVSLMRNKFLNAFDEIALEMTNNRSSLESNTLESEAESIAQELGITLEDSNSEDLYN